MMKAEREKQPYDMTELHVRIREDSMQTADLVSFDVVHLKRSKNPPSAEIIIDHVGHVAHQPGDISMKDLRNHDILHCVVRGKGSFTCGGRTFLLQQGDLFLFPKDTLVSYRADMQDPWEMYYVGFFGEKADYYMRLLGLSESAIALHGVPADLVLPFYRSLLEAAKAPDASQTSLQGWFYLILGALMRHFGCATDRTEPIDLYHAIANYIQANLSHPLRVAAVADRFHISQSQMYRLFMENVGISPQRYYNTARMNYACTLIHQSVLSFKEISQLCGYEYESHFYKAFRKELGMTPAEFRKMR